MKIETYLAKFYDVIVLEADDIEDAAKGERHIEIYEKGEDSEPIGYFVTFSDIDTYQWRNVYGKVGTGTAFHAEDLKSAAKAQVFTKGFTEQSPSVKQAGQAGSLSSQFNAVLPTGSHTGMIKAANENEVIQHIGGGRHVVWDRKSLNGDTPKVGRKAEISKDGIVQIERHSPSLEM